MIVHGDDGPVGHARVQVLKDGGTEVAVGRGHVTLQVIGTVEVEEPNETEPTPSPTNSSEKTTFSPPERLSDSESEAFSGTYESPTLAEKKRSETKNLSLQRLFHLPEGEEVLWDCPAALLGPSQHHGRLYLSQHFLAFHSHLFGEPVNERIPFSAVTSLSQLSNTSGMAMTLREGTKKRRLLFSLSPRDQANLWTLLSVPTHPLRSFLPESETMNSSSESPTEPISAPPSVPKNSEISLEEEAKKGFLEASSFQPLLEVTLNVSVPIFAELFYAIDSFPSSSPSLSHGSQNDFARKYHLSRGDQDVEIQGWQSHSQWGHVRTLTYRAPVHAAVGPSSTRIEETQRYYGNEKGLVVEIASVMHDLPYGDYFRVEARHTVKPAKGGTCHLSVEVGVNFLKKTFFEGRISSGVLKESKESFSLWSQLAQEEIASLKGKKSLPSTSPAPTSPTSPISPTSPTGTTISTTTTPTAPITSTVRTVPSNSSVSSTGVTGLQTLGGKGEEKEHKDSLVMTWGRWVWESAKEWNLSGLPGGIVGVVGIVLLAVLLLRLFLLESRVRLLEAAVLHLAEQQ